MSITIQELRRKVSATFPEKTAESWDNPGLLLGRGNACVSRVLTALELTPDVLSEAIAFKADLILTHHPFIFKPLKSLTDDTAEGRMLLELAENHIALMAAHTNLDCAPDAIIRRLSEDLKLSGCRPFLPHSPYEAYKIVVFVPHDAVDAVAAAMHEAGAGSVGAYSDVSFRVSGLGKFTCGADSHPAIGTPGSAETVEEYRLEMVVSGRDLRAVTQALIKAHPYEEPAYDVFELRSEVRGMTDLYGFGVSGTLPEAVRLSAFIQHLKGLWDIPVVRFAGDPEKLVRRVAILNGSGAKYLPSTDRDVDAYITGDCGHHDFDNAVRRGVVLIDAGHYDTEKFIPEILADLVASMGGDVMVAHAMRNPMQVM